MDCQCDFAGKPVVSVARRLGSRPVERGCDTQATCPDVFELASGNFLVIGTERTADNVRDLPADAGCGADERMVELPREVFFASLRHLAAEPGGDFQSTQQPEPGPLRLLH
jgi:hypothetical protein